MASVIARLPSPPLMFVNGSQPFSGTLRRIALPPIRERRDCRSIVTKATGESSESSIVKTIQSAWDKSEDRLALIGLGFAGVVVLWASVNFIAAIDKLPVVPGLLELIGILFTSWFTYRYLLFKPDREELSVKISKSISDILGQ